MKRKRTVYFLLALAVFIIATLACASTSNTGTQIGTTEDTPAAPPPEATAAPAQATAVPPKATAAPKPTAVPTQPRVQIYKVGDIVQVQDHTIVLNSAKFQNNILKANFTIENKGAQDVLVSSMMSFSAKDTDGVKLEQSIFDCGTSLDGKVLPGDKLKGDICWKATTSPIKIYYEANLFGSGAVVWQVTK